MHSGVPFALPFGFTLPFIISGETFALRSKISD
jgi:hypothetical protein